MLIYLKDNAKSFKITTPRPLPKLFEEAAQLEIDKHLTSGVLVKCDEPSDWCPPGFFVPKSDGKRVHLVTGYTRLNKFVIRPVHPFPSISKIV